MVGIRIVRYLCDIEDRYPDIAKIIKILKWLYYDSVIEARAFLDVCVCRRCGSNLLSVSQECGFRMGREVSKDDNIIKTIFYGSIGTDFDKL